MRVLWSAAALHDYSQLIATIASKNPDAADRVADAIEKTALELGSLQTGRRGRVSGTYEKIVPRLPYILAYAIAPTATADENIVILHVIHGARDWPPGQWPR
jgi:toxin ParE1/3/4